MSDPTTEPLRLHLGGVETKQGWKILNAQPGPGVDYVGTCDDLSAFDNGSVDEVYASHIFEHLDYFDELPRTLGEVARVMKVGGLLRVAVPDLAALMRLITKPGLDFAPRFHTMRMIYGGQFDPWDYHKCGFTQDLLVTMLGAYQFGSVRRVASFGLFRDTSELVVASVPISLNVTAVRGPGTPPKRAPWVPPGYERRQGRMEKTS